MINIVAACNQIEHIYIHIHIYMYVRIYARGRPFELHPPVGGTLLSPLSLSHCLSLRSRETSIARSVDFYVFLEAMRCSKGTRMPVVTAPSSNLHREVR